MQVRKRRWLQTSWGRRGRVRRSILQGMAPYSYGYPGTKSCMPRRGQLFALHTRLDFCFSLPFLLSAIGAQVALVLSLLLSLLSFRVEAIWRGIFPINLFERVFNFLAWNRKTLQRPVVSVKLRGCVCCLSSHLRLCTLLGVMRERGRSQKCVRTRSYNIFAVK